jgi:hypothetical protein
MNEMPEKNDICLMEMKEGLFLIKRYNGEGIKAGPVVDHTNSQPEASARAIGEDLAKQDKVDLWQDHVDQLQPNKIASFRVA